MDILAHVPLVRIAPHVGFIAPNYPLIDSGFDVDLAWGRHQTILVLSTSGDVRWRLFRSVKGGFQPLPARHGIRL